MSTSRTQRGLATFAALAALALLTSSVPGTAAAATPSESATSFTVTSASNSTTVTAIATVTATPAYAINRWDRAAVLSAYRSRVVLPARIANTWTGRVSGCIPGSNSASYTAATISAINWARAQAGITALPGLNSTLSTRAQSSALMMQAQGALSHAPQQPWRCWTDVGAKSAAKSTLSLGVAGASAIAQYMVDPGASNVAAGHRRWLLFPRLGRIGIGNTKTSNAIYVLGTLATKNPAGTPAYYAWPTRGYFPRAAEPRGRWSLSSSLGYSFSRATVKVIGPGGATAAITRYSPSTGLGDNTLVWQLASIPSHSLTIDKTYRVTVSGIRTPSGATRSYTYAVTLVS